ncbi:MAG: hypothetical protein Q8880_08055 [Bacteroidota bacterium]|nr:hypothetical protein [Bacteroidota bacterium]
MSKEAEIIAKYLIGENIDERVIELYHEGLNKRKIVLNHQEERLWRIVMRFPILIGFVDGGLYFIHPTSSIRKKLYLMLAILETSPLCCNYFLSRKFSKFYILKLILSGIRGVYRGILGYIFVKLTGYQKS